MLCSVHWFNTYFAWYISLILSIHFLPLFTSFLPELAQPSGEGQWGSTSDPGAEYRTLGIKGVHANPGPYQGDTSAVVGGNGQQRGVMAAVAAGMFVLMLFVILLLSFCRYYFFVILSFLLSLCVVIFAHTSTLATDLWIIVGV